jgi:hypothetical protein
MSKRTSTFQKSKQKSVLTKANLSKFEVKKVGRKFKASKIGLFSDIRSKLTYFSLRTRKSMWE